MLFHSDTTQIEDLDRLVIQTARSAGRIHNAFNELVTFAFDENDKLIGLVEQPVATLDDGELALYIETVAEECDRFDRFEYVLTGDGLE